MKAKHVPPFFNWRNPIDWVIAFGLMLAVVSTVAIQVLAYTRR
jgi:hypothetical protein